MTSTLIYYRRRSCVIHDAIIFENIVFGWLVTENTLYQISTIVFPIDIFLKIVTMKETF